MAESRASSDRGTGFGPYLSQIDADLYDGKRRDSEFARLQMDISISRNTLQSISEFSSGIGNPDQITPSQHRIVSTSSSDNGDDTGLMDPSTRQSPQPYGNRETDLAVLNRKFQDLTSASTNHQAANAKELSETKKPPSRIRQDHDDLREEHNDYKTTIHWKLQKLEADLNKAFLEIHKIRMDMQETLNRQASDIRRNADEIALHAKEEWQDAPSNGDSVIRGLEQKMTELKPEVKAVKRAGKRKGHGGEDGKA
ncbi:hypothetical protein AC578_5184 [Pseudocercospora eumusae]|uniref:Uncharacterized protein n=1 Tax=Pseudocercospora eumusae TaxID=321146 RepID=A0A139HMR9_9PEZI|nr:hypothetical protein AC578_5184 [Pseudocercospora eumusae]